MHKPQQNMEDDWEGLELQQPRGGSQMMLYAGMGVAGLFGLVVCVVAVYFIWTQFRQRGGEDEAAPIVVPSTDEEETAVSPTETAVIAPTSTLPAAAAPSSGNVEAVRLASTPTIDGSLGEWDGVMATSSSSRVYTVAGWDGSEDLTAVWQLAWDNANLYLAVTVTDDTHVQTASG
ncbi:MAG: hypothetical protein KC433_25585, partial [Anaerolineales bacterium]|nr:hypothetical protein [Anaerolineales bacterium]